MKPTCFISVDVETTGPTPAKYHLFEIGACLVDDINIVFETKTAVPKHGAWDPKALAAIGVTPEKLPRREEAPMLKTAMRAFAEWTEVVAAGKKPVFVANCAPFDWMFIATSFDRCGIANPFGHQALDMKAYFMGKTGRAWHEATLARMAEAVGLPKPELPHRALEDAKIQAAIFRKLLER